MQQLKFARETPATQEIGESGRVYNPPPDLWALSALSRCHGVCFSLDKSYFKTHVFAEPCIRSRWLEKLANRRVDMRNKFAKELDQTPKTSVSKVESLKRKIASLRVLRDSEYIIRDKDIGEDGPFGDIYRAFTRGFLDRLDHLRSKDAYSSSTNGGVEKDLEWNTSVNARIVDRNFLEVLETGGPEELMVKLRDFVNEVKDIEREQIQKWLAARKGEENELE